MEVIDSLLPTDNVVIDAINDEFFAAIQHLRKQDIIGLAVEEQECDRYSVLEWLCVSTSMCTFLFDIQKLGKRAFREGLKRILESPLIVKIFHDCRRPSDCLFHQYDTKLINIYDTQVADFVVYVQKANTSYISKTVNNLYQCLTSYLQIPVKLLPPRPNKSEFNFRPVKPEVEDFLIKNVIYLRFLKKEMDVMLRIPFRRCVDVYMQSILRKSDGEMKLRPPALETVPSELLCENMQVFGITEQLAESNSFTQRKEMSKNNEYRNEVGSYGDVCVGDNYLSRDFDRTEVINFLMERMFYGSCLNNGSCTPSMESGRYSVKSLDRVPSLCDPECSADYLSVEKEVLSKREDNFPNKVKTSLSALSKIKKLSKITNQQCDSKMLPSENLSVTDTLSDRSVSKKSMSKILDLVKQLKKKSAVHNVDEELEQNNDSLKTLPELLGNSIIDNKLSKQMELADMPNQSKEMNNNLAQISNILGSMGEENPIAIITSKNLSPFDKYKYVMAKRREASSMNSSTSDSNHNISSKNSDISNNVSNAPDTQKPSECFSSRKNAHIQQSIDEGSSNIMPNKSIVIKEEESSSSMGEISVQNVIDENDPWEKLRSAFDDLGPQRAPKKSSFVPAGMNY